MIKQRYAPKNNAGYALLTTMFVMITFLSFVFAFFHPLAMEAGNDGDFYMVDRNFNRYRQALFGAPVDQCPTTLAHCSSLYGDYPDIGTTGTSRYLFHRRVWARIFGTAVERSGGDIEVPQPYQFTEDHFWSGYWGKRYQYILPSDHWNGDTYFDISGQFDHYFPFWGPHAQMRLSTVCGGSTWGVSFSNNADFAGIKALKYSATLKATPKVSIVVRDFSPERNTHALRLVLTGSANHAGNMYFEMDAGYPEAFPDHRLYLFEQDLGTGYGARLAQDTGQKKLTIQVQTSPGAPWVTRDTRTLVMSPSADQDIQHFFRVNFYG
jgi:hypothetical protein